MSEELRLFYQNESSFNKNSSKEELMKDVFVKAFRMGRDIGYNVGYNSGLSVRESFDDGFDDTTSPDDYKLLEPGIEGWDACEELLNS